MATFKYNALTSAGRLMKGIIEAGSREEAGELLQQMELAVNSIEKAKAPKPRTAIGRNEFMLFNQQLASITKAGIPLERGLRELASDISSKSMRKLIDAIAGELEAGVSIEKAFEKRQKRFPPLYGRILKAGVETGRLSEMLTSLNRHLELANQTRRIIFEALSYPAVILALAAVILTAVFLIIIPQFGTILTEMTEGSELPKLTRLFLSMAENVVPFWIGVGFLVVAILFIVRILSSFPAGRRFKESLFLRALVIGRVYHSSVLSRMAESMAMMVAAGSDMPACLRLGSGSTGSEKLVLESEMLAIQIEQGADILGAGQFCKMIPRLFLYSIQLGTQRNELQDNLYSLGQMYSEQARCGQARLQAILLPVMLIVVGGVLAMAVLSMFLPMITIITNLSV
ncbi:MAG TPA: type II secretion system F family protein [Sedimentisphaerales bacterium]|nr:type II secretion system F family protein [Sedimentisphaerales bacterium]